MNRSALHNLSITLGNIKILKTSRCNKKSDTPRMRIFTDVFEGTTVLKLEGKNQTVQECLDLLTLLKDFDDIKSRR